MYTGNFVSGIRSGYGEYNYASGRDEQKGYWENGDFTVERASKNTNTSNKSTSQNNNNSQSSTNPLDDIQESGNKFIKHFENNPSINFLFPDLIPKVKLSNSGVNVNGEKCKKCKIVLKTPKNRACYICNRQFSGWGFIKKGGGKIILENSELSLSLCWPRLGLHNNKDWNLYEDACCSRQCAMKL